MEDGEPVAGLERPVDRRNDRDLSHLKRKLRRERIVAFGVAPRIQAKNRNAQPQLGGAEPGTSTSKFKRPYDPVTLFSNMMSRLTMPGIAGWRSR